MQDVSSGKRFFGGETLMNKLLSTAILLAGMALATNASAATFTSDHCTGGCGGDGTAFATITGTQINANTVDILITPLNG